MVKLPPHLQRLADELPADKRADIEEAIATSPYLQQRMTEAMQAGQLQHIRLTPPGANESGHYDDRENAIYISVDIFTKPELNEPRDRIDVLTSTLGHETGHALNARESKKTLYFVGASITEEMRAAGPGGSVDVTPYFALHQRSARRDEAMAEIEGWNALASRIEHTSDGKITGNALLERMDSSTSCINPDDKDVPQLAPGIVLDQNMHLSDVRLPKAGAINLEPVAQCHFDPPTRSLGAQGKADYRNYYGAYLIEQIGQDTAAWRDPPLLKLDMARLGLDPAQLESTGLNLGGRNLSLMDTGHQHRLITLRHAGNGQKHSPDETADLVPADFGPALKVPTDLRNPTHPGHGEFKDVLGKVHHMEASRGFPHGPHSEHVAAALLVAAERNRQGIAQVEMRADGRIHGLAGRGRREPAREVIIDPAHALGTTMEQYTAQWSQLRSPHLTASAPAAERTHAQARALAQLSPTDRTLFARIRGNVPAHISDDHVAHAMWLAKQDGITDAGRLKTVLMAGDTLWVVGNVPGFRATLRVSEPVPGTPETVQQTLAFNAQREQQRAMEAMPRNRETHAHEGLHR